MEPTLLSSYGIFKTVIEVIYAPHKAFKEIVQNPKYIGPVLIMILFIIANMGFVYAAISKTYVEQTLPTASKLDEWTENSTLWTPTPTSNYDDYINGTYYGNKSLQFSIVNSMQISMQLNDIGPINCSGQDGYKNMSIRMKWISPDDEPNHVTLYLFSPNESDYFYYDLTENFTRAYNNVWNNLTIPLGSEKWLSNGAEARWDDINGLKFEFTWLNNSEITILVDGLFFRGVFRSLAEDASSYLLNFSLSAFMQFTIKWVLLSGILYIMSKAFGAKTVWKPLLIVVGFALITLFIQTALNAATYATSPTLYYPLELIGGVEGESEIAYNKVLEETWLVSQVTGYVQIAIWVWTIALCAIALRSLTEISWAKSFLVSTVAFFVGMLIESFIFGQ
jgi:hypothetical protein